MPHNIIDKEMDCLGASLASFKATCEAAHDLAHKAIQSAAEAEAVSELDAVVQWVKEQNYCANLSSRVSELQRKIDLANG